LTNAGPDTLAPHILPHPGSLASRRHPPDAGSPPFGGACGRDIAPRAREQWQGQSDVKYQSLPRVRRHRVARDRVIDYEARSNSRIAIWN
jgi:hypothetical protein